MLSRVYVEEVALLRALHIDDGRVVEIEPSAARGVLQDGRGLVWIDLVEATSQQIALLCALGLDDERVAALVEDSHRPKCEPHGQHLVAVVHGVDLDATRVAFTTHELDVVLGDRLLVTHATSEVDAVRVVWERLKADLDPPEDSCRIFGDIVDVMVDVYLPFLELIEDRIDALEPLVFADRPGPRVRAELYSLRRDAITLRRIAIPQAEAMDDFARLVDASRLGTQSDAALFRELREKLRRMAELADSYRDLLDAAFGHYQAAVANAQNEVMKVLTLISAVLLPLTVITGVYGMNFDRMPELRHPNGYPIVLVTMAVIVVLVLSLFRWRGWIGRGAEPEPGERQVHIDVLGRVLSVPVFTARVAAAPLVAVGRLARRRLFR